MPYIITKDRALVEMPGTRHDTIDTMGTDNAWQRLLEIQGQSVSYALENGYSIVSVPERWWSDVEAQALRVSARRMFEHRWTHIREEQEHCEVCNLNGSVNVVDGQPNYAGWHRIWVEAGRSFTPELADKVLSEAYGLTDNLAYQDALCRSVTTFGLTVVRGGRALGTQGGGW